MARNFSGTATTSAAELAITGGPAYAVYVKNSGATALQVNVPIVHGADDYDTVAAGESPEYRSTSPIQNIFVKTASGTTTYVAGVTQGAA